jgi:hypothetical protein
VDNILWSSLCPLDGKLDNTSASVDNVLSIIIPGRNEIATHNFCLLKFSFNVTFINSVFL